jgi:hypothetical protein
MWLRHHQTPPFLHPRRMDTWSPSGSPDFLAYGWTLQRRNLNHPRVKVYQKSAPKEVITLVWRQSALTSRRELLLLLLLLLLLPLPPPVLILLHRNHAQRRKPSAKETANAPAPHLRECIRGKVDSSDLVSLGDLFYRSQTDTKDQMKKDLSNL